MVINANIDIVDEYLMFVWYKVENKEYYTNLHVGNIHGLNIKNINITIETKIVSKLLHYCGYLIKWLIHYYKKDILNIYNNLCIDNFNKSDLLRRHEVFGRNNQILSLPN